MDKQSIIMKWFVVTMIIKCEINGEPTSPGEWTCLQQIHVIRATDRDMAYEKAIQISKEQECTYKNEDGNDVTWTFIGLEGLEELDSKVIRDGTEIWGRIFETSSPEALVVEKDGLQVFYIDQIRNLTAAEILESYPDSRLVINRT